MGNHNVGRAMAAASKVFWAANGDAEVSKEKALEMLDAMAEGFIGADAEFDDELTTDTPLSRLLCIAFDATPEHIAMLHGNLDEGPEMDRAWDSFYDGPYDAFSKRYRFC